MALPTNRTTGTDSASHRDDHNTLHTQHNISELAPRGIVGTPGSKTADANMVQNTLTDVSGLSVTFTTVAGRRYRCRAVLYVSVFSAGGTSQGKADLQLQFDGTVMDSAVVGNNTSYTVSSTNCILEHVTLTAPSAASHTWKIQAAWTDGTQAAVVKGSSTRPSYIYVEDIGV